MLSKSSTRPDKRQQGRPQWNYDPAMQFYFRFVMTALHDALRCESGLPTDEAILARDWFATSTPGFVIGERREFISFDECCHWLGINADVERIALLELIDGRADFDTDEAWERLAKLSVSNPDDTECLFEAPDIFRVVPVRDQIPLFLC